MSVRFKKIIKFEVYPYILGVHIQKIYKKSKKHYKNRGVYFKMIYFSKKIRSWQNYVSVH